MAARDDGVNYDQLHHFIGGSVFDTAPLEAALLVEADKLVGGEDASRTTFWTPWRDKPWSPGRFHKSRTVHTLEPDTLEDRD